MLCLLTLACNDEELFEPQPAPLLVEVFARPDQTFNPRTVTVRQGGTVEWDFGSLAHTVLFEQVQGRPEDIFEPSANKTDSRCFGTAGTFQYQCGIHDGMDGTVIVEASAGAQCPP
jgi:plastocyanin